MNVSAIIVTRGNVDLSEIIASLPAGWEILWWDNGGKLCYVSDPHERRDGEECSYALLAEDLAVYGRYAAIEHASGDLIYVQDDDCVVGNPDWGVSPAALVETFVEAVATCRQHGRRTLSVVGGKSVWVCLECQPPSVILDEVVCNMPQPFRHDFYSDHALVGFGAVFHRDAPKRAFDHFGNILPLLGLTNYGWWLPPGHERDDPPDKFLRTCDVVFTALTPRTLVDVPYRNLPWATADDRMYRQPEHVGERSRMLALALSVRDA